MENKYQGKILVARKIARKFAMTNDNSVYLEKNDNFEIIRAKVFYVLKEKFEGKEIFISEKDLDTHIKNKTIIIAGEQINRPQIKNTAPEPRIEIKQKLDEVE